MDGIAPMWQAAAVGGLLSWMFLSSFFNLTLRVRSLLKPCVLAHVLAGDALLLRIQKYQHWFLDLFFSALSCVVSVPFYTAFLPLVFWSGHGKLARQMTILMAFCDYLGNCLKDIISAPRPTSPPVKRLTATKDEEENAMEYGFPSSHTLNTVCLSGYLLRYVLSFNHVGDPFIDLIGYIIFCLFVGLIGFGRMYLGMHSLIDIVGGLVFGLVILSLWLTVHDSLDNFIVSGQNVESFWAILSVLLLFAYPTPELPTPSFEFHTAFDGVALGIVTGVRQTYNQFHHEQAPRIFTPQLPLSYFCGRILVGIPTILLVKFCSKTLAKWALPVTSNALGVPIRSTTYVPALFNPSGNKRPNETKQGGYLRNLFQQDSFDVDTGIRFLQYTGLAWAVVDPAPTLFFYLGL